MSNDRKKKEREASNNKALNEDLYKYYLKFFNQSYQYYVIVSSLRTHKGCLQKKRSSVLLLRNSGHVQSARWGEKKRQR